MRFFGGWVKDISPGQIRVELSTTPETDPGDVFYIEMTHERHMACCRAVVITKLDRQILLSLADQIRIFDAKEAPRIEVHGIRCTLTHDEIDYLGAVRDISIEGIGVMVDSMLFRGAVVDVRVHAPLGDILLKAEVRFCREEPNKDGQYRAGLKITTLGRLERARWVQLFSQFAAA